jgi:hypothetical protein
MFISKAEKADLFYRIAVLESTVLRLQTAPLYLTPAPEKKRTMSPETRAKISEMMKKRHADAKAKKENA